MRGQIVKILSNLYFVSSNDKVYECHSRGKFRNQNITPVVGDYVVFDDENNYILEIEERKNSLERPLVSNVDQGFIVTSVKKPDFSTNLLDKLISVLEFHQIKPVICITKWDLLNKDEKKEITKVLKYYKKIGYPVIKNTSLLRLKWAIKGKTTVFTGQTGAGKSSLLNRLNKNLKLATGEISEALGRGKHTTRHVELIRLYGGKVLDTPGFSSIDFTNMDNEEIRNTFVEFEKYPCPYKDCMHLQEKECSVKKNVENGNILESRYENYQKFLKKSRW
ncbi:MAG: ribosome small subunit-dependent GTPase A [Firmicutes bacterium]|nr:ribosome small subunit-dependent GTPase A [Bacillota bacterium]